MIWQVVSTGSVDTQRLGEILGSNLTGGEFIELKADLGGGKTTFTQGLAWGLGSTDIVSSPTFTLKKAYKCRGDLEIHHFDFYRLHEPGVLKDQLEESINNNKVVAVVEWSDIVSHVLPAKRITVELSMSANDSNERDIKFRYSENFSNLIDRVKTVWADSKP